MIVPAAPADLAWKVGFLGTILVASCRQSAPPAITSSDSAGITIVSAGPSVLDRAPAIRMIPLLRIGGDNPNTEFFMISGIQELPGGDIAIANDATKQIRIFDSTGRFLRSLGRAGQGPMEFRNIRLVPSSRPAALNIYDALLRRVTSLQADGNLIQQSTWAGTGVGAAKPAYFFPDGSVVIATSYGLPGPTSEGTSRLQESVVLLSYGGDSLRSLGRYPGNELVLRSVAGGLTGGDAPFPHMLHVAANDSAIFVGTGDTYEIRVFMPDGTLRRILRTSRPMIPVTADMRREYRAVVMARAHSPAEEQEWRLLSGDDVFPPSLPAFDNLVADRVGRVWIREQAQPRATTASWHIWEGAAVIGAAQLPTAFTPFEISGGKAYGVWKSEDGTEEVQVYSYQLR